MDNLKKYLQQHLDELDTDVPGDAVWQQIQKTTIPVLPIKNKANLLWRYAAAACVLLGIAISAFLLSTRQAETKVAVTTTKGTSRQIKKMVQALPAIVDTTNPVVTAKPIAKNAAASKNVFEKNTKPQQPFWAKKKQPVTNPAQLIIEDIEHNYAQLLNMQLERLRITPVYAESPDYFNIFKQQFKQIETDEATIKKDIRQHGLNDELLQQLININQQKLNVLKDLQAEIGKLNNKIRQPENGQDSSHSYYLNM